MSRGSSAYPWRRLPKATGELAPKQLPQGRFSLQPSASQEVCLAAGGCPQILQLISLEPELVGGAGGVLAGCSQAPSALRSWNASWKLKENVSLCQPRFLSPACVPGGE